MKASWHLKAWATKLMLPVSHADFLGRALSVSSNLSSTPACLASCRSFFHLFEETIALSLSHTISLLQSLCHVLNLRLAMQGHSSGMDSSWLFSKESLTPVIIWEFALFFGESWCRMSPGQCMWGAYCYHSCAFV